MVASLMHQFGRSPAEVADLTDRQLVELYWHKRNRDGEIVFPEPPQPEVEDRPSTFEEDMAALDMLAAAFRMPAGNVEEARRKLREKHGRHAE